MKIKLTFLTVFLVILLSSSFCQNNNKYSIISVEIVDKALSDSISNFIEEKKNDSIFNNIGYLLVSFKSFTDTFKSKIIYSGTFNICFSSYDELLTNGENPFAYSFINNKIVVFSNPSTLHALRYSYKKRSVIQFKKKLQPFIQKTQKITFNEFGKEQKKIKNFKIPIIVIDGGKRFYKFYNGSLKVINEYYN